MSVCAGIDLEVQRQLCRRCDGTEELVGELVVEAACASGRKLGVELEWEIRRLGRP